MTWIKLPDGLIINMEQVQAIRVSQLTNPSNSYQILALAEGHAFPLANEIYSMDKVDAIIEAVLQAADVHPVEVNTKLKAKSASIPPELQND